MTHAGEHCASAAIQCSVLPSALSLGKVHLATAQTRVVVDGILQRLRAMAVEKRPKFFLFWESLGSQVSQEMFEGQGLSGPAGIGARRRGSGHRRRRIGGTN
ncbi:MAG TPA: alpha/beta-hydrolase family protein [Nakamurella sp.]|nr:alpha/beta-hydrolase family protein [Nakamurella sp.]